MAPYFVFPRSLSELEQEPQDSNRLYAQNPHQISSIRSSQLEEFVKGVSFDLSDRELFCVEDQDVFDRVYSLIRDYASLPPSCKFNLVETLRSNFSVLLPNVDSLSRASQGHEDEIPVLDRLASHRNAFKIYMFFLFSIVLAEESNKSSSGNSSKVGTGAKKKHAVNSWDWEVQRGRILGLIANSLEINLEMIFGSSDPDESFLSFISKNVFSLFENVALLKDSDVKDALCSMVGSCSTKYHYVEQSCASIMHMIHKFDFVVTHIADAIAGAEKKYGDATLATSLIRDIGRTNPKDYVKDTVGAENVGHFLVELADRLPKLVSTNIGILVPHFGGESYKIRNALVSVLGKLIMKAFKNVEGDVSSRSIHLRTKQAMLEILLERCRDVSAYTRSRVLQVWSELCEEHSISIGLWNEVAEVAAGRLEDKSAIVRKYALNLLINMLQHNPFGPQLRISSFEATLEQYKKKIKELEPDMPTEDVPGDLSAEDVKCNGDGGLDNLNSEAVATEYQDSLTDTCMSQKEATLQDSNLPDVGSLEQTRALVASLEAGLSFSKCIGAVMPTLVQLMASSSATDVENTILLLMRCKQFQIDGSEECLRKMLPLVFSQDKSIYEAVENAFQTIYIRKNPVETAKNLFNLAIDSNIGDLAALECIVGALVSKGDISLNTISALWDFFCFNVDGTTAEQSRGALSVLCMVAKKSDVVLSSHLVDIIDIGFGRWAKVDPLLARTACLAIQRLSDDDKKKLLVSNHARIFGILESLITGYWLPSNIWYAAADKAIAAIYSIHPTPETMAANFVKKSVSSVFNDGGSDVQSDTEISNTGILTTVQVAKLERCLFVISHTAMNQLVYIESCARKIQKQKRMNGRKDSENETIVNNGTLTGTQKDNDINAELGFTASEDAALDALFEKAEKEIISGGSNEKNLIGVCATFLSKLCRNFGLMQKYPELQASAMLALCRMMIIDADFCNANLQLLFTVVESSQSEIVRSNCTIALGDLAVRFPNLLEPWTEMMYARLRDPSVSVRKNAVLVLSHLILNDMMKVKGYINEMAVRLEDDDERISSLAKLFFNELSKKGSNPVYNLLPDILSKLSNQNLSKDSFCNIMQYLITSIKKDRQMEALVEKLCNYFSADVRQWEHISYCLSQLAFTEKGMKKLIELFKTYEHALSEDSVMDHFRSILNKGKKFTKPELKSCIEEFEDKLNKFHMERKEQEVTTRNARIHQQKISSREGFVVATTSEEPDETDGEVIDPGTKMTASPSNDKSKGRPFRSEDHSGSSSELIESDQDDAEVSSVVKTKGFSQSRTKKSGIKDNNGNMSRTKKNIMKDGNGDVSVTKTRRNTRSRRRTNINTFELRKKREVKQLFVAEVDEGVQLE
ncbi:condensin complex subunit 1 [Arachis ipaensis]|uniref:condensin complex subunit 1 n=1 Tax=Arachis ipaensis TaxID=130454 RepID=UPI000A2B6386|nr:condensin complex subunit 1 [Arachis ipaensis]